MVARPVGASWTWKANWVSVLVADWVLRRVKGIPGVTEATFTVIVVVAKETLEEAWRLPEIWREPAIVEEAEEINPPAWVARPATDKVEEADNGPATCNEPATVDEAEEIKPESKDKVPLALNLETSVSKPFCKVEKTKAP